MPSPIVRGPLRRNFAVMSIINKNVVTLVIRSKSIMRQKESAAITAEERADRQRRRGEQQF